ncbi:MAG TPA: CehA/McbA family metallohydrolase [Chryseosolibacter sp.]
MDLTGGGIPQFSGMKKRTFLFLATWFLLSATLQALAQKQVLDPGWYHIRNAGPREWAEFPDSVERSQLLIEFSSMPNPSEYTLSVRQYDVKLSWRVLLNGELLGSLIEDEKDMLCFLKIPEGVLKNENVLEISTLNTVPDDIRLGEIAVHSLPENNVLNEAHVSIEIFDGASNERIPSRVTIVNARGVLHPVSANTDASLAVRSGHVYTGSGRMLLGLPEGTYTFYATRGFEYSVDSAKLILRRGDRIETRFILNREVPTAGWISSDTHIHTFTGSGHGDASASERVLTIAGEGIELPIITDHNIHMDLDSSAKLQGVQKYFKLVAGNEVTTRVGHFNIFPVEDENVVDHQVSNWKVLSQEMGDTEDSKAIILNHGRDIHLGFRPLDPTKHLSSAGMRLDNWELPMNAMEIINSGSQQSDQMELTRDWFGMLNAGHIITPVGSSDSHDVSRFIVGQARTYIRTQDEAASQIDVLEATKNFVEGSVMVSFGLLASIEVNNTYGPGEIVPASDEVEVSIKVCGPAWARIEKIALYANGKKIREEAIQEQNIAGVKWSNVWNLTSPAHDMFLVAVAEGPAECLPYWPIAKPFQPVSTEWNPKIWGISGAVWLDADGNGEQNSAYDYALSLHNDFRGDLPALIQSLASFDEAVAIQAAALLHKSGKGLTKPEVTKALENASPDTKSGFATVIRELRLK